MSHDLIRHSQRQNGNALPTVADNLWGATQNHLATANAPAAGEVQPLKVVHRSLRGRYGIALVLAAVGATVGTIIGWSSNERVYRARGLVKISPTVTFAPSIGVGNNIDTISEYARYMSSEATTIRSAEIVEAALKNPEWINVAGNNTMPVGAFFNSLTATYVGSSQDILITFDHPNAKVAQAGLKATLGAYAAYRNSQSASSRELQREYLEAQKKKLQDENEASRQQIMNQRREHERGNIETVTDMKAKRLTEYENRISDMKLQLRQMEMVRDQAKKNPKPIGEADLARRDPFFARLIAERDTAADQLASLSLTMGQNAPTVIKLRNQLKLYQDRIDDIAKAMASELYGFVTPIDPTANSIEVTDVSIASLEQTIQINEESMNEMRNELGILDKARLTITELNDKIDNNKKLLDEVETKLNIARAREMTTNAPFITRYDPETSVAKDKRPTMATFGFVVGAGLPVLALALYGLFDRRFRYSDEATQMGGTRGIPLLGILPHLPDRLSDPSQASVAAHCVHQIRTMLQLNCLNETANVLSITSSTSGDGKTSLALALGLSFAASGSRTLLVDTDLIGGGLSARLNIREPVGISEAIVARNPMEMVRVTDVNGLSVLPVGNGGPQNASAFSPIAVRRLFAELRKQFDIIIIDTGPILGSIEATPVVAASDAVVLTVSRTQNRDLVEKAITQLRSVGANIAGVVFNRANARDFERSVSGISLRSVSRSQANGHSSANGVYQDKHVGPLVHSVRGTRENN